MGLARLRESVSHRIELSRELTSISGGPAVRLELEASGDSLRCGAHEQPALPLLGRRETVTGGGTVAGVAVAGDGRLDRFFLVLERMPSGQRRELGCKYANHYGSGAECPIEHTRGAGQPALPTNNFLPYTRDPTMASPELMRALVIAGFPDMPFRFETMDKPGGWTRATAMDFRVTFGPSTRWLDLRAQIQRRVRTMGQQVFVCDACGDTVEANAPETQGSARGQTRTEISTIPQARIECKVCSSCVCSSCYVDMLWSRRGIMECQWCGDKSGKAMSLVELQMAERCIIDNLAQGGDRAS